MDTTCFFVVLLVPSWVVVALGSFVSRHDSRTHFRTIDNWAHKAVYDIKLRRDCVKCEYRITCMPYLIKQVQIESIRGMEFEGEIKNDAHFVFHVFLRCDRSGHVRQQLSWMCVFGCWILLRVSTWLIKQARQGMLCRWNTSFAPFVCIWILDF